MATSTQSKKQELLKPTTNNKKTASEQLKKSFVNSFERFEQLLSAISHSSQESLLDAISQRQSDVVPSKRIKISRGDTVRKISSCLEVKPIQLVPSTKSTPWKVEQLDVALETIPLGTNVLHYLRVLFTPANILDFFDGKFNGKYMRLPKLFQGDLYDCKKFKFFKDDSKEQEYLLFQVSPENVEHIENALYYLKHNSARIEGPNGCGKSLTSYFIACMLMGGHANFENFENLLLKSKKTWKLFFDWKIFEKMPIYISNSTQRLHTYQEFKIFCQTYYYDYLIKWIFDMIPDFSENPKPDFSDYQVLNFSHYLCINWEK